MSGLPEILPWALENFPPENYDTFDEWYQIVSVDFEESGRMELDEILDHDEIQAMKEAFEKRVSKRPMQQFIDESQLKPDMKKLKQQVQDITHVKTTPDAFIRDIIRQFRETFGI